MKIRWCTRAILSHRARASGPHGSGSYENLTVVSFTVKAEERRLDKEEKEEEKERENEEEGDGWSEVSTYDSYDPLVNIGRWDGSWEFARGENKDTRCSDTDNDRRPTDRPREAVRNATEGISSIPIFTAVDSNRGIIASNFTDNWANERASRHALLITYARPWRYRAR